MGSDCKKETWSAAQSASCLAIRFKSWSARKFLDTKRAPAHSWTPHRHRKEGCLQDRLPKGSKLTPKAHSSEGLRGHRFLVLLLSAILKCGWALCVAVSPQFSQRQAEPSITTEAPFIQRGGRKDGDGHALGGRLLPRDGR